ncbi:BapA/Bap/LapF family large adhesin [Halomonas sp. AOP5-CZ2-32]
MLLNLFGASEFYEFTVEEGSVGGLSFDANVGSLVSLFDGAFIDLQVMENGEWISLSDSDSGLGLIDVLGIFGSSAQVEASELEAGEYRVVYGSTNVLAAGSTINWAVEVTDTSLTDFSGLPGDPISGNVITDPSFVEGEQDQLGIDDLAGLNILVDGVFVDAGTGTVVEGEHGQLTIDADGNYTYEPNGDAESVGQVEVFEYQLVHPDGTTDTANLYIRIDSEDADLVWDDSDLSAPAVTVDANDDLDSAQIEVVNIVTTEEVPTAIQYTSVLLFGGSGTFDFSISDETVSDVTIDVSSSGLANLLTNMNFTLSEMIDGQWVQIADGSDGGLIDIIGIGADSIQATMEALAAGEYRLEVSNAGLGLLTNITAGVSFETTHLTEVVAGDVSGASGNVIVDDHLGSDNTAVSVMNGDGVFVIPGHGGLVVEGEYGQLTIMSNGDYEYVPNGDNLNGIGQTDSFTYKLTHPNGDESEATLTIDLEAHPDSVEGWEDVLAELDVVANDDNGIASIDSTFRVESGGPDASALDESIAANANPFGGSLTRSTSLTFTVDENRETGITLTALSPDIALLSDSLVVTITGPGGFTQSFSGVGGLLGLGGLGVAQELSGLQEGSYDVTATYARPNGISTGGTLSLSYETDSTTFLDEFVAADTSSAIGNVLADDNLGSSFTVLQVEQNGDWVEVVDGTTVIGDHGTLTINADGSYVYEPNSDLEDIGGVDSFTYRLEHPNGTVDDATLSIDVEHGDGPYVPPMMLSSFSLGDMDFGDNADELVFPESEDSIEEGELAASGAESAEEVPMGDFSEPQDPLSDEFDQSSYVY